MLISSHIAVAISHGWKRADGDPDKNEKRKNKKKKNDGLCWGWDSG